jgi:hypothetical protein
MEDHEETEEPPTAATLEGCGIKEKLDFNL